jgi:hypothetical protein
MSGSFRAVISLPLIALTLLGAGCAGPPEQRGLSVVMPTHAGEGHGDGKGSAGKPAPGSSATPGAPPPAPSTSPPASKGTSTGSAAAHGSQPDPVPLSTAHQWDLTLHYAKGTVRLEDAKPVELAAAVSTPRRMGRFAVELWVGKELVDRVRFDFPLLGADALPGADRAPIQGEPRFSPGADTRTTVRVPASDRATAASIVDRLSGGVVSIPWPPSGLGAAPGP